MRAIQEHKLIKSESHSIAIIGLAFRFPGDLCAEDAFWDALKQKRDLVTQIPEDRWSTSELKHLKRSEPGRSITFSAGVLSRIDEFDAGFFGISPREAAWLDPQQRLLLELSWEAMENAGVVPSSMAGSDCAVYVGISSLDYGVRSLDDMASMSAYSMTGNTLSIAANRLSYVFDLRGPSLAVDTACSSSLVALHHACNSLRAGEASMAMVGGVNLLLHPYPFVGFTKASMLSADGRCKPFDEAGNGYVRSEGCAVLLLKPLEHALRDGDNVHAVILASGVNADGARKTGITIPSSEGQAELMAEVLGRSGLKAEEVDFIEAHGTGTVVGDPIETAAIGHVYGQKRNKPLPISSVKANLGHLESASGMAGLVKAMLALKHRALPPALHLHTLNSRIDFTGLNLQTVTDYMPIEKEGGKPLVAGVNSFGFGGANAHVLLQEYPSTCRLKEAATVPSPALPNDLVPLLLSARTEDALRAMAQRYADLLKDRSKQELQEIARTAVLGRERMEKRLALYATDAQSASCMLRSYAQEGSCTGVYTEDAIDQPSDVAFIYSGNGAQWLGMGRRLMSESPGFAAILAELDEAMRSQAGFSLLEELQAQDAASRFDDTSVAQPLLFGIQVAITRILVQAGLKPNVTAGHSVGEIAAAWAAGALTLEQAIEVICARSKAQALTRGTGRMAAAGMTDQVAKDLIADMRLDVEVAGLNSPNGITLSGSLEDLQRLQRLVEPNGTFFRLLDLDYAFHSRQMDPIEQQLRQWLQGLQPAVAQAATFVSTVTGGVLAGDELDAGYWWRNVREPVCFSQAVDKAAELGCRIFVEIGPHAILQRYISDTLSHANIKGRALPTLRRGDDGLQRLEEAALRTLLQGDAASLIDLFGPAFQRITLPNYPWQRQKHWHPRSSESALTFERRREHPLLGWRLQSTSPEWENTLDTQTHPWLADHQISGAIVYPGAAYAEMALAAAREWLQSPRCAVEQLDIITPMVFDGEHGRTLRLTLNPRDGSFQISSRQRLSSDDWTLHATGRVLEAAGHMPASKIPAVDAASSSTLDQATHYRLTTSLGLNYGLSFQGLQQVWVANAHLEALLIPPPSLIQSDYLLHPALLDVCFQTLVDFFAQRIEAGQGIALLPVKMGYIEICSLGKVTRLRAQLLRNSHRSVLVDFELLDADEQLVAVIRGCRFRAAHLKRHVHEKIARWSITPRLLPHPLDAVQAPLLSAAALLQDATDALAEHAAPRQGWFKQTLPLIEALVLSFGYEACQQLRQSQGDDWQQLFETPYGRWLAALMHREELLVPSIEGRLALAQDPGLPAADELWRAILQDNPECLPQLSMLGRVGRQLTGLLDRTVDASSLVSELHHSPIAEAIHHADPSYAGVRIALEAMLGRAASDWPTDRRLRVLEISAGLSELPYVLLSTLPHDRFDYVLAVADPALQARQASEFQAYANIAVTGFDPLSLDIVLSAQVPQSFDVLVLRHTLHRSINPQAALARLRSLLAINGSLWLAERHADWSVDFVEGLDLQWWHAGGQGDYPQSSLQTPQVWQQVLQVAGFDETELFLESQAQGLSAGAYLLLGRSPTPSLIERPPEVVQAFGSWMLLVDAASQTFGQQLGARLREKGQEAYIVESPDAVRLSSASHIVSLVGWHDGADVAAQTLGLLLGHIQTLARKQVGQMPKLWMLMRGGALACTLPEEVLPSPAQAARWGFGRVVMNEVPQLCSTLIELACDLSDPASLSRLENELLHPDGSSEIVLGRKARYCLSMHAAEAVVTPKEPVSTPRVRLDFHVPGQLRNLVWLPQTERALRDDEVEVRTHATGLNFRDVMYLMGLLPDEAVENGFAGASLGLEFSGVVSRVGDKVRELQVGDAVMGFGASCFASHVVTPAHAVANMPTHWSFEAAATVPTVFLTVYYAFKQLADLQPGERVLIHGAAGGVGIAAIQLARHLGAKIYATAGSDEKRDFVHLLGADHVFDSRSLSFAEDVMTATGGQGVDVVLNSLAGEAMRRSLDVLKPFGRFLELGKRDFFENTPVGLRPFRNNISYFGIDADQLMNGRPQLAARLFKEVMALFHEQVLTPLPLRSFSANRVVDAFRLMQQARHIGKIVVSLDVLPQLSAADPAQSSSTLFNDGDCWLVTGGLSGFGLESARWLVGQGVRNLVLVGRRGTQTPGAQDAVDALTAQGIRVLAAACDVADAAALAALLQSLPEDMPALTGVLHAAATFDDRLLHNLDAQSMESVLTAKLQGAWNLHCATATQPLRHFVLYSSITTAIGNPGQGNYVAANAGLEALAALRKRNGQPATCMAWGPIGDAGYLERNQAIKDGLAQRLGKPPIAAADALTQLGQALRSDHAIVMPADFDWNVLARLLPSSTGSRFTMLNRLREENSSGVDTTDIGALLASKTPHEAAAIVSEMVTQEVAQVLCIPAAGIKPQASLHDLGMDSLMAVELALGLEQRFGIQLPVMMLNDSPSVSNVTARIVEKLVDGDTANEPSTQQESQLAFVTAALQQHGEGMTTEQLQALAQETQMLAQKGAALIP
ncbi:MAG: SDR family NAD(P)-dependent oxidoreductase [Comamonas sp.]